MKNIPVGRQFLPWNAKTAPPTQVLSITTSVSSFQMVCHIFCGALYVRKCRHLFFQFHKWGWHFGRLSSKKFFVRWEQRNFCDQLTLKNWKSSAYSRFNQLNVVMCKLIQNSGDLTLQLSFIFLCDHMCICTHVMLCLIKAYHDTCRIENSVFFCRSLKLIAGINLAHVLVRDWLYRHHDVRRDYRIINKYVRNVWCIT